jgi:hypothetical protein
MKQPLLVVEIPFSRATGGHRCLCSDPTSVDSEKLAALLGHARADEESAGESFVGVARDAIQSSSGRDTRETILLLNVNTTACVPAELKNIQGQLRQLFDGLKELKAESELLTGDDTQTIVRSEILAGWATSFVLPKSLQLLEKPKTQQHLPNTREWPHYAVAIGASLMIIAFGVGAFGVGAFWWKNSTPNEVNHRVVTPNLENSVDPVPGNAKPIVQLSADDKERDDFLRRIADAGQSIKVSGINRVLDVNDGPIQSLRYDLPKDLQGKCEKQYSLAVLNEFEKALKEVGGLLCKSLNDTLTSDEVDGVDASGKYMRPFDALFSLSKDSRVRSAFLSCDPQGGEKRYDLLITRIRTRAMSYYYAAICKMLKSRLSLNSESSEDCERLTKRTFWSPSGGENAPITESEKRFRVQNGLDVIFANVREFPKKSPLKLSITITDSGNVLAKQHRNSQDSQINVVMRVSIKRLPEDLIGEWESIKFHYKNRMVWNHDTEIVLPDKARKCDFSATMLFLEFPVKFEAEPKQMRFVPCKDPVQMEGAMFQVKHARYTYDEGHNKKNYVSVDARITGNVSGWQKLRDDLDEKTKVLGCGER